MSGRVVKTGTSSSELLDPEQDLGALGAADPVALARLDRVRPVDGLEIVEQRLRVVGDPEEPLLHQARLDLGAAALAAPVVHLLVREHRLVVRAPLDRRALPVGEPALEEAQELPLLPAVVVGVVRGERARPVVRPADPPHRARDVLDVALGALTRVDALLDRGVLGRQPERVEPLRVQHVHAVARAEARHDVADRVDEHVPDVERPRGVREHLEDVALRPRRGSFETWNASASSQTRCHFSSIAFESYCSIARLISSRGTKKPLAREAWRERRGYAALAPWTMQEAASRAENGTRQDPRMLDLFPDSARVERGELELGGIAAARARRAIRHAARRLLRGDAARSRLARSRGAVGASGRVFYGTKAFPNVAVLRLLREEGVGADVASAGELAFARAAGLTGRRARRARQQQGRGVPAAKRPPSGAPVVVDAPDEVALAAAAGVERVLVRVTLGVDADTHEAIVTGHHGSKFGLPPAEAQARDRGCARARARRARPPRARRLAAPRLHGAGGDDPPARGIRRRVPRRARLGGARRRLGGGFGIRHHPDDDVPERGRARARRRRDGARGVRGVGLAAPEVWLEPGRSLVGRAGVTLYRVGAVKRLAGANLGRGRRRDVRQPPPAAVRRALHGASAARAEEEPDEPSASPGCTASPETS